MLEILIFLSALITLVLIGIRFGFLEILAIILAVLALVPIVVSVWSYFAERPIVTYQVFGKKIGVDDSDHLYQCYIVFSAKKGGVIVKDFFLTPEWGVVPEKQPDSTIPLEYTQPLEETGFNFTAHFKGGFPSHGWNGYPVQFRIKDEKNKFKLRMVLDTELDPMKQGIFSVFHGLFDYRLFAEVQIDFANLNRQEGQFRPYYF